ncbi:MAG: Smr/MutS family protein [Pseudomonadota bacterium]
MTRRRKLTEADKAIWTEVKKSIAPLRPKVEKPLPDYSDVSKRRPIGITPSAKMSPFTIGQTASSYKPNVEPYSQPKHVPNMDRRNYNLLVKGKKAIDLTVDLHGMTLTQAEKHIQKQLFEAYRSGKRLILVVTGKGNKTSTDEFNRPRSGVLRQSLPQWCAKSPLSSIVLQVTPSQQRHGGSGAYYVYLKRAR